MGSPDILLAAAERALYLASEQSRPPPTEPRRARAPDVVVEPPPTQLEALRVLVADDDEATLRATRRILERFGCEVTAVASAREALSCITGPEAIDLLVTHIVMPEMSGFTLVDIATRARKDLPVLYMSGYPQEEVYWGGTPGPRSAFMSKPMRFTNCVTRLSTSSISTTARHHLRRNHKRVGRSHRPRISRSMAHPTLGSGWKARSWWSMTIR